MVLLPAPDVDPTVLPPSAVVGARGDDRQLLEACYRVFTTAKRTGADWDVWADAGAEAVLEQLAERLWPGAGAGEPPGGV